MSELLPEEKIHFKPFGPQKLLLASKKRTKGGFAGKRGGKTEWGAVQAVKYQERKPNYDPTSIDPYLGVIMAPTYDMLRRLSMKKFLAYGAPFIKDHHKTYGEILWHDNSEVYGLSADRPERIEGIKAHWIWLDEVFQMSEQLFLECMARVSDTRGYLICTGSLGVQYVNPKMHWAYKYFKESPDEETICAEWTTADNPHFPREEIERLKDTLDPETYRQMFELVWDVVPKNAVYADFTEDSIINGYVYKPELPTFVSIDWGYAHNMAVGFFQYDLSNDRVVLFDEIVQNRMELEAMWNKISLRHYEIHDWFCDIAGNQEREQTGKSNVKWFKDRTGIALKYRSDTVQNGIALVRSYIKNVRGARRFFISSACKKSIDGMKQYRYAEKDGIILNENPVKKDDDACDMVRYFFINAFKQATKSSDPRVVKTR